MSRTALSGSSRAYIAVVVTTGLIVVLESLYSLSRTPVDPNWLVLAVLTLLSGSFTVRIPSIPAKLSVSETFVFSAALLFGAPAATMIVVLDTLVISFWLSRQAPPPWSRLAFNVAAAAVAISAATHSFYYFTHLQPLAGSPKPIGLLLPGLFLLATLYFLFNSWLVAFVVGLQKKRSPFSVWRHSFLWLSLNYYSGASVAALLLPYFVQAGNSAFMYIAGLILPVLLISYLTFKTALGRIEDANAHLSQLNRLYLSTIETLAMAIDAKDQITHGHIRRVQQYAVNLAKHLGITDQSLLSAIEAASLLHDMGKLAVPEYILNKPGKLTPAEFERMKLHASIGADILSAIDFPYPVVPIVRHHHENWNGTGYPQGLHSTAIPIGARILAVVDCFDALTSDRPYRPRMADGDAIRILLERRGSMYDPVIVDAFIAIHARSFRPAEESDADSDSHATETARDYSIPHVASPRPLSNSSFDEIASSTEETLVLYELASSLSGRVDIIDVWDIIGRHLRRIVPTSVIVLYAYNADADELVSLHASGNQAPNLIGLRIPRGERLSGWVAANKQTIANADPTLDLGDVARLLRPRLRSCLSTPLLADRDLVGVLTLYSVDANAFNDEHKRLVEIVGRQVSQTVRNALRFGQPLAAAHEPREIAQDPSNVRRHEAIFGITRNTLHSGEQASLIYVTVRCFGNNDPQITERAVEAVARAIRNVLRGGDVLFRYPGSELVVLLTETDAEVANLVADRIRGATASELAQADVGGRNVSITLGIATSPTDGKAINELAEAARSRQRPLSGPSPSIH
jgi:putative nucleotidyltransferase with HDIG domain